MIETVSIGNFKSLEYVELHLGKFNCLVGMNGVGKTTILQALDLLAQVMHGNVDQWLEARGWASKDLLCRTGYPLHTITLGVGLRLEDGRQLSWGGILHRSTMRVVSEAAFVQNKTIFAVSNVEVQT